MKHFNHIRIISIFLLILIPLFYLYDYFDKLAEKNQAITEELVKEQLLSEMGRFQEDLIPENYITKALKNLDKHFNIPDFSNGQYNYSFNEKDIPNYIDKDFKYKACNYLRGKFGFEPFIFISTGYDLTFKDIEDRDKVFKKNKYKNDFLNSSIGAMLIKTIESESCENLCEVSSHTTKVFLKGLQQAGFTSSGIKNIFSLEVVKHISVFYKDLAKPHHCYAFFANKFGNQRVYEYYNCLLSKGNKKTNFLGLYYILVKGSDIDIKKLLYTACYNPEGDSFSKIKRRISNKTLKAPTWSPTNSSLIEYEIPFPSQFYNFVLEHRANNEEVYNVYNDYFQTHSLNVSIDRKYISNDYLIFKEHIERILIFIFLIIILYILNIILKIVKIKLTLSLKVRAIVLVAVLVPMIGLWTITYLGIKNEEKILIAKTENIINDRLSLFDKLKNDVVNNISLDMLHHKKIVSDAYFDTSSNNFFVKSLKYKTLKTDYFMPRIIPTSLDSLISHMYYLNKNGNALCFNGNIVTQTNDLMKFLSIYRVMADMKLLDSNTQNNKKFENKYLLLSSLVESYLKTYNRENSLAKESFLISGEGLTPKDKISIQLVASKNKPNSPCAITYNFMNMRDIMTLRLNQHINQNYQKLLSQNLDFAQIKYAIFDRTDSTYREKIRQPVVQPFRQYHLEAVNKAINMKNSSIETRETDDYYIIKVWRYYNDNPIIFVGAAIIPKSKYSFVTGEIFALFLLIYSIFAVILLSDFFSSALLEPIKTLSKFINEISLGHLNVKINMKTGDELEDLSNSFNKMSDGLCEREKLKRFVSDKLFSSLEKTNEQKITQSKVTILSSDIRSFTTISEKNNPEDVVSLLNDYFTLMEKSIVKYGGSIEKIVGDAIVAAFYEEKSQDYALQACKAAKEMRESLKLFNNDRISKGLFPIENGIGLATGEVMIGFAGQKARRREFLLIGDIIKSSEKLESMTKNGISSKIYIDKQTYENVNKHIEVSVDNLADDYFYRELIL